MSEPIGGCYKISYATTKEARIAAEGMKRRKGEGPIRIYLCDYADHFHTTSWHKGVKKHERH